MACIGCHAHDKRGHGPQPAQADRMSAPPVRQDAVKSRFRAAMSYSLSNSRIFCLCRCWVLAELLLRLYYTPQQVQRLVKILQFDHPIADFLHRQEDFVGLLLGPIAEAGPPPGVVQDGPEPLQPAFQLGKHPMGDGAERVGNACLQPAFQLLGVDAVVDELLADVVEGVGQSQHFLRVLRQLVSVPSTRSSRKALCRAENRPARRRPAPPVGWRPVRAGRPRSLRLNSSRASTSRVSVISCIIASNRCRNTNSRDSNIVRNCSGVTTSRIQRSLLATFGPRPRSQRSAAFTLTNSFCPGFNPFRNSSTASTRLKSVG